MTMRKTILVLGGTGMLGQPAVRCLTEAGFQVRVMTRDRQKAETVFGGSVEIAAGDPTDAPSLEAALDGCYGIHISLPNEAEQPAAELAGKIAAGCGVERITYSPYAIDVAKGSRLNG